MPSLKQTIVGVGLAGTILTGGSVAADNMINPYTTAQVQVDGQTVQTLDIATPSTLPEAGTDETIVDTDTPTVTLSKWDGEVQMGVTLEGVQSTGGRPFLSKSITWTQDPAETMEAVPLDASTTMEDGGMEINIDLASEPASNVFNFAISGADDLDFFYQAPLWQEAGLQAPTADCTDTDCLLPDGQTHRPDNIVGSYAVYYKDHANHIEGQTNYATGKAFQVFRPLVTDANGSTTWADLSYDDQGTLTVTAPQAFLDNAAYPVIVDPTFGYTTIGATKVQDSNQAIDLGSLVSSHAASTGDTVTQYQIYSDNNNDGNDSVDVTAYSIVAGTFSSRLSAGTTLSITSATAQWWLTGVLSQSLSSGTTYGPAFGNLLVSGSFIDLYRDTGSGNQGDIETTAIGAQPATWSHASFTASMYSVYSTYTASVAPVTPPITDIVQFQ